MNHYKTGRWSKDEKKFVEDNYQSMTVDELSRHLERPPNKIAELVSEFQIPDDVRESELNIRASQDWKQIVKQMNEDEQEAFLYHWTQIIEQFKSDITHTERMQIMDVARTEILINRVLKRMYDAQVLLEEVAKEIKTEQAKDITIRDVNKILQHKQMQSDMMAAVSSFQQENKVLTERKQSILRDIKGTRDQRKKRIEDDSKATLKDWIITLIQHPEIRSDLGIEIEKFRHAVNVEYERLSEYYQYQDLKLEQPIINSDNILPDNQ